MELHLGYGLGAVFLSLLYASQEAWRRPLLEAKRLQVAMLYWLSFTIAATKDPAQGRNDGAIVDQKLN